MRSADLHIAQFPAPQAARRWALALLACVALSGCASVAEPLRSLKQAVMGEPKGDARVNETKAAAAATVAASAPEPKVVKDVEPEIVVSLPTQRAFDEARRLMRAGRVDEAERAFRALTKSNPELGGPHANLGVIYRETGKSEQAIAELELAVKASPRQPIYYNQLGVTYRQAGQFDKARQAYEKAVDLDANYAPAVLNLGILLDMYLGDGKRALELYERYLALSPQGDTAVTKWIADLKNRKPAPITVSKKEKE